MAKTLKLKNKKSLMCGDVVLKQGVETTVDDSVADYLIDAYPNDFDIVAGKKEEPKNVDAPKENTASNDIPDLKEDDKSVDDALAEINAALGDGDGDADEEEDDNSEKENEIQPLDELLNGMDKLADIKAYAKEHGMEVPGNVRSKVDVIAYILAHKDELQLSEG